MVSESVLVGSNALGIYFWIPTWSLGRGNELVETIFCNWDFDEGIRR